MRSQTHQIWSEPSQAVKTQQVGSAHTQPWKWWKRTDLHDGTNIFTLNPAIQTLITNAPYRRHPLLSHMDGWWQRWNFLQVTTWPDGVKINVYEAFFFYFHALFHSPRGSFRLSLLLLLHYHPEVISPCWL